MAFWATVWQGPTFVANFRVGDWSERWSAPDFAQEWSSARNYLRGIPVYAHFETTAERYGEAHFAPSRTLILYNAHPPASIMLALPLARLDFEIAFLVWNLASIPMLSLSLWLVGRGLGVPFSWWSAFPATVLVLLCYPLFQQIHQGQLNIVLLALLCGVWAAERSGRPRVAGSLLGAAAAIKIFPGFLIAYYAVRRQWLVVMSAVASLTVLTGVTIALFGPGAYRSYAFVVLPEVFWFRVCWNNNSLAGFWYRLFDPAPWKARYFSLSDPLSYSPVLARAGYLASASLVAGIAVLVACRTRCTYDNDRAFGIAVTAMLLIAPIVWEHYFLLLLIPLAVVWCDIGPCDRTGWLLALVVAVLWVSPVFLWRASGIPGRAARPLENLTVTSVQFYALLALFALSVGGFSKTARHSPVASGEASLD